MSTNLKTVWSTLQKLVRSNWLKKYWPILILIGVEIALFVANYVPGTYLVGWDNLMPELNLPLNINRSFWGVWQEYRGLGFMDSMSHVASLVYDLLLIPVVAVFPINTVRYLAVFSTHLAGALGMWFFAREIFKKYRHHNFLALAAALFYALNIGTIQMFYAPYETFTFHFAFLPWLTLSLIKYLENALSGHKLRFPLGFLILSFLATPQAHVPSVWLVYLFSVIVICSYYLIFDFKAAFRRVGLVVAAIAVANAFWLIPYGMAVIKMSPTIVGSKINEMSTQEISLRNEAFGDFWDTLFIKSYMFDFTNHAQDFTPDWFITAWRDYYREPAVVATSVLLALLAIVGGWFVIRRREKSAWPFLVIFVAMFLLLGSRVPLLGLVAAALKRLVPLFYDVFRFAFTKFSTLYVFSYSLLVGFGLLAILHYIENPRPLSSLLPAKLRLRHHLAHFNVSGQINLISAGHRRLSGQKQKFLTGLSLAVFSALILVTSFKAFSGYFLYPNLRNQIPSSYFKMWDFFSRTDPSARIAMLPVPTFWGWTDYDWGARGSGFVWFNLPQALLDLAFNPWSRYNEQYYFELSQAINAKDPNLLSNIINKYHLGYLVVDDSINPNLGSPKDLLNQTPGVTLVAGFDSLNIYRVVTPQAFKQGIAVSSDLPRVSSSFKNTYEDAAFNLLGDYQEAQNTGTIFPLASLFTNKLQRDLEFTVREATNSYTLEKQFPAGSSSGNLVLPSFTDVETLTPVEFWGRGQGKTGQLKVVYLYPQVIVNGQLVAGPGEALSNITLDASKQYYLSYNNKDFWAWEPGPEWQKIGSSYLVKDSPGSLNFFSSDAVWKETPQASSVTNPINCGLQTPSSQVANSLTNDVLSMEARDASNCSGFVLSIPQNLIGRQFLVQSSFSYRSKSSEQPQYCLASPDLYHCYNSEQLQVAGSSPEAFSPQTAYTEATFYKGLPVTFSYVLPSADPEDALTIEYRDTSLRVFPKVLEFKVPKPAFPSQTVPVTLAASNTLQVTFPKNDSFYTLSDPIAGHRYQRNSKDCATFPKFPEGAAESLMSPAGLVFSTKKALLCQHFYYPYLPHSSGYILTADATNSLYLPLKIVVTSPDSHLSLIETSLATGPNYLVVPALLSGDIGFGVDFYASSVGMEKNTNTLSNVYGYPMPYNFIKALRLDFVDQPPAAFSDPNTFEVVKMGTAFYGVTLKTPAEARSVLLLNQAFDSYWLAWDGQHLLSPILVNNWEMAFRLTEGWQGTVYVIFWPAFLVPLGLVAFLGAALFFFSRRPKIPSPYLTYDL